MNEKKEGEEIQEEIGEETDEESTVENPVEETEGVKLTQNEYNKLISDLATEKQSRVNLQSEIKEVRLKKQEQPIQEPSDIEKVVNAKIEEYQLSQVGNNQDKALDNFLKNHPEFDAANDVGGVMLNKFQKNLERLNTTSATSVEDFEVFFEDTLRLMGYKVTEDGKTVPSEMASTPPTKTSIKSDPEIQLSTKETKLVKEHFGGDQDAYQKMKTKRPDYIATLVEYIK